MLEMRIHTQRYFKSFHHLLRPPGAAKSVDAYGSIKGNDTQQCDAQRAYVQTELGGVETWISLPKILRPKAWDDYVRIRIQYVF